MSDLTLKHTFIDRGGAQVYDVIKEPTEYLPADCLGQVRIPPDPRIKEMEAQIKSFRDEIQDCRDGWAPDQPPSDLAQFLIDLESVLEPKIQNVSPLTQPASKK